MANSHERAQWRRFTTPDHVPDAELLAMLENATCWAFNTGLVDVTMHGPLVTDDLRRRFHRAVQDWFGCCPHIALYSVVDMGVDGEAGTAGACVATPGAKR